MPHAQVANVWAELDAALSELLQDIKRRADALGVLDAIRLEGALATIAEHTDQLGAALDVDEEEADRLTTRRVIRQFVAEAKTWTAGDLDEEFADLVNAWLEREGETLRLVSEPPPPIADDDLEIAF